jgi:hypothetical protein
VIDTLSRKDDNGYGIVRDCQGAHFMNLTDILCPTCKNSLLREIKLPAHSKTSIGGDETKPEKARLYYVCLSCTKMLSEEELIL